MSRDRTLPEARIAVFLDRDGVINEDRAEYVTSAGELVVFDYVPAAISRINRAGLRVFVVSNQQGIAKGLYTWRDLREMEEKIDCAVLAAGGEISGYYYCPHLAEDACSCRKPEPGLLLKAAAEHDIRLEGSFMVGDHERDLGAARAAGCRAILVLTGAVARDDAEKMPLRPEFVADTLAQAADYVIEAARAIGQSSADGPCRP